VRARTLLIVFEGGKAEATAMDCSNRWCGVCGRKQKLTTNTRVEKGNRVKCAFVVGASDYGAKKEAMELTLAT
jgi:hypothetical protein